MKTYLVFGCRTVLEYRSKTFEAQSKTQAYMLAKARLEEDSLDYFEWEKEDAEDIVDFKIYEVVDI